MSGRGLGADAVADEDAAVPWGEGRDRIAGEGAVVGKHRGDEASLAAAGERGSFVEGVVGHDGGDRAERLDIVDRELQRVYADAGHPERWKLLRYDVPHQETPEGRREALAFLEAFL